MKNKITKYSLFGTILVFLVVLGCKQDDFYYEEANTSSKNLKVQWLNHSDLEKHPKMLEKLETLINKKSNHNARMIEVPQYGFIVDTDYFVRIEDESRHGYTFRVYRDSLRTDLENLVLNYNSETQRYDAYLVEYVVDENDFQNILDYREIADFTSKTNITPLLGIDSGNIITQSSFSYSFDCSYSVTYTQQIVIEPAGVYGGIVWYTINVPVYNLIDCTYVIYDGVGGPSGGGGGGGNGTGSGGNTGGNGTGNGGGSGNGGNNGNNNGSNPPSGFTNANNLLTTPVVKNSHIGKLNSITNQNAQGTNEFRNKIDEYVGMLDTAQEETGVMYNKNYTGGYTLVAPLETGFNYVKFPPATNMTEVIIHVHHNFVNSDGEELLPVPSEGDIFAFANNFYEMGQYTYSIRNNLTSIVVSRTGLHALRINNPQKAEAFFEYLGMDISVASNGDFPTGKDHYKYAYKEDVKDKTIATCNGICTPEQFEQVLKNNFIKWFKGLDSGFDYYYAPHPANPNDNYVWTKQN